MAESDSMVYPALFGVIASEQDEEEGPRAGALLGVAGPDGLGGDQAPALFGVVASEQNDQAGAGAEEGETSQAAQQTRKTKGPEPRAIIRASNFTMKALTTLKLDFANTDEREVLLRACKVRNLLARFGLHFDASKQQEAVSSVEQADELFRDSAPVERINEFISHSWRDPRLEKYLTVCLYYGNTLATPYALAAGFLGFVLTWQEVLPAHHGSHSSAIYGPWGLVFGVMAHMTVLLLVDKIPRFLGGARSRDVFFDKLCIHQHDPARKRDGIAALGAFIAASDRVLLLWNPVYFTRLWCTFEIAATVKIAEENDTAVHLDFEPLALSRLMCSGIVGVIFALLASHAQSRP
eukprot:gb/GFBE01032366.1/.p1 GENE.gb/GFBE01032366.1/~~gb/GFBE01032366.1/.p1  ORF type:complete len:351 (+),score=55.08 gb/GFBE01032366.1/:1-1053(+)